MWVIRLALACLIGGWVVDGGDDSAVRGRSACAVASLHCGLFIALLDKVEMYVNSVGMSIPNAPQRIYKRG